MASLPVEGWLTSSPMDESPELRLLFHRLNNQLGIILAHAELLEAKAPDEKSRARAAQVVASTIDVCTTSPAIPLARVQRSTARRRNVSAVASSDVFAST